MTLHCNEHVDIFLRNRLRNDKKKEGSIFNVNLLSILISWTLDFISAFLTNDVHSFFKVADFKKRFLSIVCTVDKTKYFCVCFLI